MVVGASQSTPARCASRGARRRLRPCCILATGIFLFVGYVALLSGTFIDPETKLLGAAVQGPPGGDGASTEVDRRLSSVHSLQELRDFCARAAPGLRNASWADQHDKVLSTGASARSSLSYAVVSAPVCVNFRGDVFLDEESGSDGDGEMDEEGGGGDIAAVFQRHAGYKVDALKEEAFRPDGTQSFAVVVPALALLTKVRWADTNLWHLLRDGMGALTAFFIGFNDGELFRVPTQAVLLRDSSGPADSAASVRLSATVLNALSSPFLPDGGFFPTAQIIHLSANAVGKGDGESSAQEGTDPRWSAFSLPIEEDGVSPLMICYCQALEVHGRTVRSEVEDEVYDGLQDLVARQFGEDDYQKSLSLKDIEARRLARYAWASQFWHPSPAFNQDGVYRPRALVIRRQTRRIGHMERYVERLKQLDFRVQEVEMETLPPAQRYHLGRYADVVVGMYGADMAHALWMDRFPMGCRAILEFRPWALPSAVSDMRSVLGPAMGFDHHHVSPDHVAFGHTVLNEEVARKRLMSPRFEARVRQFPEFNDQTAFYADEEVFNIMDKIRENLMECLQKTSQVERNSPLHPFMESSE